MNKLSRLFSLLVMVMLGAFVLTSCHGQSDDIDPSDEEVPAGVLRIFADKKSIAANGSDIVTFTAKWGAEDVSAARTLQLVRTCQGVETYMTYGTTSFSTVVPGEYTFRAEYYFDGVKYHSDNEVVVEVTPTQQGGETHNFAQKVLGLQFTSVGCPSCPVLGDNLKAIQAAYPGRLVPISLHRDFEMTDPMAHSITLTYYKLLKAQGLPQFNANLIIDNNYITVSEYSDIVEIMDRVESNYPATCGVAMESSPVVGGDRAVKVKVKVKSNTPSAYRYQIFLLEDGINEYQQGAGGDYIHNNVVREVSSNSAYGDRLNEGVAFQVGVEVTAEKTITVPSSCDMDNLRVVVAVFSSYDGGNTYVVNNCAECSVGESIDYEYK